MKLSRIHWGTYLSLIFIFFVIFFYMGNYKAVVYHHVFVLLNGDKVLLNDREYVIDTNQVSIFNIDDNFYHLKMKNLELNEEFLRLETSEYETSKMVVRNILEEKPIAKLKNCHAYKFKPISNIEAKSLVRYEQLGIDLISDRDLSIELVESQYCRIIKLME